MSVILAIDTATEQCSVALSTGAQVIERVTPTARGHAELILPMVNDVLREAARTLTSVDALAFGRGPGSFTGVRVAVGVVQGLAFAANKPVVGISNLAAVALQFARTHPMHEGERVMVSMDARMQEVYWAEFEYRASWMRMLSEEAVAPPSVVQADAAVRYGVGTGWEAHPTLRQRHPHVTTQNLLPRAREIALLAELEFAAGRAVPAALAEPVYVRDRVAWSAK